MYTLTEMREEYGHTYVWCDKFGFWSSIESGKTVLIFPPGHCGRHPESAWFVVVPQNCEVHNLVGDDGESRSFAIAAGFITQPN